MTERDANPDNHTVSAPAFLLPLWGYTWLRLCAPFRQNLVCEKHGITLSLSLISVQALRFWYQRMLLSYHESVCGPVFHELLCVPNTWTAYPWIITSGCFLSRSGRCMKFVSQISEPDMVILYRSHATLAPCRDLSSIEPVSW